jgi:hypothetical protein
MDSNNPIGLASDMTCATFALGRSVIRPVSAGPMSLAGQVNGSVMCLHCSIAASLRGLLPYSR